jgi:hypothetical protein
LYLSPDVIRAIKLREVKKDRGCNKNGGNEKCKQFKSGNLKRGDNLGDTDIEVRIILKWVLKEWDVKFVD